ncbi:hypothetical protein HZA97_01735 [Candidatus Woesearchaeota archaeon]|nr:hypothetical protein [Candidatus Woesearchaeota archaeon]
MANLHELFRKYVQERQQVSSLGQQLTQQRVELTDLEKALDGGQVKDALTKEIQTREGQVAEAKKALEAGQLEQGYNALFPQEAKVCVAPVKKDILAGLDIELRSDKFTSFSENLERLRLAGYDRHIRPAELIEVLSRYFEGDRNYEQTAELFNNSKMVYGNIAWVGLAARLKKGSQEIEFALDPEFNTPYKAYLLEIDPLKASKKITLNSLLFNGIKIYQQYDFGTVIETKVNELPEELVELLCGRSSEDLPEKLNDLMLSLRLNEREWSVLAFGRASCGNFYFTNAPTQFVPAQSIGVKNHTSVQEEDKVPTKLEYNGGKKNERSIKQVYSS